MVRAFLATSARYSQSQIRFPAVGVQNFALSSSTEPQPRAQLSYAERAHRLLTFSNIDNAPSVAASDFSQLRSQRKQIASFLYMYAEVQQLTHYVSTAIESIVSGFGVLDKALHASVPGSAEGSVFVELIDVTNFLD